MPRFLILYISEKRRGRAEQQIEDIRRGSEPWVAWFSEQGPAVIDHGNPTGKPLAFNKKGKVKPRTEKITGYTILEAKDIEKVKSMIADNPHLDQPKTSIEIMEIMPML